MADPRRFEESRAGDLLRLLDAAERERLGRFRHPADARAYLLAHAMRRAAVARALGAPPADVGFSDDRHGKPLVEGARGPGIFFSHSRRREGVACVVTRAAAVGIDVESEAAQHEGPDFALLDPYMELPEPARRAADMGPDQGRQFRCYWTALEAYWKAQGTGLASSNPRVRCTRSPSGEFEVAVAGDSPSRRARVFFLPSSNELTVAIALKLSDEAGATQEHSFEFDVYHCNSSMEIYSPSMQ